MRLRAVTWNVHQWVGRDGRDGPDMDRCAAVLRGFDAHIAGLQEAAVPGDEALSRLEKALDMRAVLGPTLERTGGRFGNLLLTTLDVESVDLHDISVAEREPRGVIDAVLSGHGTRLRALVSHFGLRRAERRVQARLLEELLRLGDRGLPTVLLADCNEWNPWSGSLRRLEDWFGGAPGARRTWPARLPVFALDRIFCRPARRLAQPRAVIGPDARAASDHLPLAGDMGLEGEEA